MEKIMTSKDLASETIKERQVTLPRMSGDLCKLIDSTAHCGQQQANQSAKVVGSLGCFTLEDKSCQE